MAWDWKEKGFEVLIALFLGWTAGHFSKYAKTVLAYFRKIMSVNKSVADLEKTAALVKGGLRALMHTERNPIYITNEKGEVIYVNPAFCDMVGFKDPAEAHGFGFFRAIPSEDVYLIERQNEALQEHPSPWSGRARYQHVETGAIILTTCRCELIYNQVGELAETLRRIYIN